VDKESSLLAHNRGESTRPETLGSREEARSAAWKVGDLVILSALAIAVSYLTVAVNNDEALLESPVSGFWNIREDAGSTAREEHDRLLADKEISSGHYGRECYGFRNSALLSQCGSFTTRKIDYSVDKGQSCPFVDTGLCDDRYTAIRLSTGLASAEVIGLNSDEAEFDRTSVCTPIDFEYLRRRGWRTWETQTQKYEYHLGAVGDHSDNLTFSQSGDPLNWDVPAYSVE
jgi:hypothetical protein